MPVDIKNILIQYHLSDDIDYNLENIEASRLLCPERLDIAAKYLYLDYIEKCPEYAQKLYLEHIRVMTKGSFVEPYSEKRNASSFISGFDDLYEKMKKQGYDDEVSPIPVDRNYRIMDGAHRVAICLKLGIKVPIVKLPMEASSDVYNQAFFDGLGMEPEILDEIVRCYIRLSSNCACINIWPSAQGHDEELETLINENFKVVYKKEMPLNENGAFFYLAQIYKEYSWAQNSDEGFSGVYRKLMPCFPTFDPVRCVFVEIDDYGKLIRIKDKMRSLYPLDKHSLHITDNKAETIQMGDIILSNNTVSFLNKCDALQFKNTFKLLESAQLMSREHIVSFTGSIVLALYGIREANDLDYISEDDNDKESHNSLIPLYSYTKEQLLFQPDLHFFFFELPFLTLDCIKTFKERRGESKDHDDIKLIELVQKKSGNSWKAKMLRKKRRFIAKIQGQIIRMAHQTGTYELLRSLYKKIK